MSKRRKKKSSARRLDNNYEPFNLVSPETKKSITIIIILMVAFLSLLSLFDLAGNLGSLIKNVFGSVFGWSLYFFPVILLLLGYFLLKPEKYDIKPSNYFGIFIFILAYSGIFQFIQDFNQPAEFIANSGGGHIGFLIFMPLQKLMGSWAGLLILFALLFISLLITFNTTLPTLLKRLNLIGLFKTRVSRQPETDLEEDWEDETEADDWKNEEPAVAEPKKSEPETEEQTSTAFGPAKFIKMKLGSTKSSSGQPGQIPGNLNITFAHGRQHKVEVPLSLLESRKGKPTSGDIKHNMEIIHSTLENFGIPVEMGEVSVGPTITQFTLKPHQGIKLSRIVALQNDLAMALAAHPIRIEAPIPGQSLVGLEVPNQSIAIVKLKDILTSQDFARKKGQLKIGLGQDVSGKAWAIDLAAMPHTLIAGATGSGKSVCINSIIISLLYQYTPDQLRMIMVDPKKVELTSYNSIPHLLTPVITEVDKTINALRWAVKEMDERYRLLNAVKKRNIESYNESVLINKLPYILIIVDELADLMVVAARDVEAAIVRLSQMARAVGIHLVVATQRPSVNVITGLIKANIPARIAFAVASQIDSRTILDASGAEKLLGKGDLLFTCAEISKPRRIQGAYLSDEEIERVIDFWHAQGEADYNDNIVEGTAKFVGLGSSSNSDNGDELLDEAKEIVIKAGKASASLLQRRLRVGYARAARLLDLLEEMGIIGPGDGAKPREILVSDSEIMGIPVETTEHYESKKDTDDFDELTDDRENNQTEEENEAKTEDLDNENADEFDESENGTADEEPKK